MVFTAVIIAHRECDGNRDGETSARPARPFHRRPSTWSRPDSEVNMHRRSVARAWALAISTLFMLTPNWTSSRAADVVKEPAGAPAATQPASRSYAGQWTTTYGPMTLRQSGEEVDGTYGPAGESSI